MAESITFSVDLPVSPERVYRAWLDSHEFSQFSGSPARIDPQAGGAYSVAGGAITGETQVMTPFSHIVQTVRVAVDAGVAQEGEAWIAEQASGSAASLVDITLEPTCTGSQLTLEQTGIPDGQSRAVMKTWEEKVFRPLLSYFEALVGDYPADEGDG